MIRLFDELEFIEKNTPEISLRGEYFYFAFASCSQ